MCWPLVVLPGVMAGHVWSLGGVRVNEGFSVGIRTPGFGWSHGPKRIVPKAAARPLLIGFVGEARVIELATSSRILLLISDLVSPVAAEIGAVAWVVRVPDLGGTSE
jgi:hypothetical protein